MIDIFYFGIILIFLNGILTIILRRNPLHFLMGIMLSLSSLSLLFFLTSRILGNPYGEIYAILILLIAGILMALAFSILIKKYY